MFILVRALVYATGFIGILLVWLPAQIVQSSGIAPAAGAPVAQIVGLVGATAGGLLAIACVLTFALLGRGTPAPFDPPRRLVVRGPYRWVRNPMYLGATTALAGAALFYASVALALYGLGFVVTVHVFVVMYEEPVLRRTFGVEYEEYCHRVGRWWPR